WPITPAVGIALDRESQGIELDHGTLRESTGRRASQLLSRPLRSFVPPEITMCPANLSRRSLRGPCEPPPPVIEAGSSGAAEAVVPRPRRAGARGAPSLRTAVPLGSATRRRAWVSFAGRTFCLPYRGRPDRRKPSVTGDAGSSRMAVATPAAV